MELLDDPAVSEVYVTSGTRVFYERHGQAGHQAADIEADPDMLMRGLVRLAREQGGDVHHDRAPILDASMPDGSRIAAIVGPASPGGMTVTIRKFAPVDLTLTDIADQGVMDVAMAGKLERAVEGRKNVLVSGGTGSGKTTLANALCKSIPTSQRVVVIEDTQELKIDHPNQVRLKTLAEVNGVRAVTATDLLKAVLRHKPSRILLGEVRGGEAWDLLQLLNTGHAGTVCTLHADSARRAMSRFETCVLMSGVELPHRAVQMAIGDSIEVVVHINVSTGPSNEVVRKVEAVRVDGFEVETSAYRFREL